MKKFWCRLKGIWKKIPQSDKDYFRDLIIGGIGMIIEAVVFNLTNSFLNKFRHAD